jgi:hypothetical protein
MAETTTTDTAADVDHDDQADDRPGAYGWPRPEHRHLLATLPDTTSRRWRRYTQSD